ncbi:MAG: hypothetical protein A2161_01770 [Candidatus Schekmanbacteria bacterium RBG_13_48_7]|uniref:Uncharacterized protein n=1 Tax=Candidatus Schekmanbacteria bacterium RBG_13_48_7 TaxID=1817878 RepID=A0A1F7RRR9_9BACT|nr:MAG: hypothetical protein A2161_01770 [Candidatus Schekmanbacteria bacterium RBG_13_48_7]
MKKIEIEQIMSKIIDETARFDSNKDVSLSSGKETMNSKVPASEDIQFDSLKPEELMDLLSGFQNQLSEIPDSRSFEPAFNELESLQKELNNNYRIITGEKNIKNFATRAIRKLIGINQILSKQEQFNGIATRSINRNIEVIDFITRVIFEIHTKIHFLSIQSKIVTTILNNMNQSVDRLSREWEHQVRRDEYVSAVIPEIYEIYKEFKQFQNEKKAPDNQKDRNE